MTPRLTPSQSLRVLRLRARLHELDQEIETTERLRDKPALEVGRIYIQQELAMTVRETRK